ncbi:M23 family metallopeptidase [Caenimonas aquaedulcis]|uniref:Peptidoglycan DD-metalloendopeptidase family protein n=1 Tax=Caenimonas aquaedulcis TaxID=2793270 RepID=A0A931H6M5_9BURK|nr:M23 family metallopeptidase [Caenimonas aquaedulcis]MBG9389631.1 peptidoglycan DD-metalloendopeptidase family protein [Caenimonas aquaedulcis]
MKNGLIAAGEKLLSRAAHALEHHPKQVTALLAAILLCGGGGAFAVAKLTPDAPDRPVREVLESVSPLPVQRQLDALDVHRFNLFRSEVSRASDTVESLLARLGVSDPAAAAYLRGDSTFRAQVLGRAGRIITAEASDTQALQKISVRWTAGDDGTFRRLVIARDAIGFASRIESAPLTASTRIGSATIRTSLFAAADEARIPDAVISQLIDIFSGDIDFHRSLHNGDRFNVVYEALEADGEPMRTGRVLSVEFMNKGQLHQAMWFQEPGRKGSYYSLDGKSLDTGYLASPMEFSRVTSGFANRFHPILHQWKAHLGVDYGAVIGTAVRAVGDGTVEFAGEQNGFGKVVIVRHNNTDETLYAHLSRIDVRAGQPVRQSQNVGAVGMTGWATGPHLHFEFRVNGVHQDPTLIARHHGESSELSAQARPAFDRMAQSMRIQLAAAQASSSVARAD